MNLVFTLLLAPLIIGLINKTKAFFAGRKGASVFQLYYDLMKLFKKSTVRSASSTWVFDLAPIISLTAIIAASVLLPIGGLKSLVDFTGDPIVFFYLLGVARFFTVLSARDVASAFPDMGSAREVQFSAIVEAIVFATLAFLALMTGSPSLSGMLTAELSEELAAAVPLLLAAGAWLIVLLSENCRVPFDDPETHLELTMIHEAMILDNSGPDLAFIFYGAALKLWLFAAFLVELILPSSVHYAWHFAAILAVGPLIGAIESSMARMRFKRTPYILGGALAMAVLALVMEIMTK